MRQILIDYNSIKWFVIDIDGTMTDSGIYYSENDSEIKRFCTRDGEAIKLAKSLGIKIIVITGRTCNATIRRLNELKVDFFAQGIANKYNYLSKFIDENNIQRENLAYIGDDINDIKAMTLSSFVGCPSDSCRDVCNIADYVSCKKGGEGAVRDVIEHVLRKRGDWIKALNKVYGFMLET